MVPFRGRLGMTCREPDRQAGTQAGTQTGPAASGRGDCVDADGWMHRDEAASLAASRRRADGVGGCAESSDSATGRDEKQENNTMCGITYLSYYLLPSTPKDATCMLQQ